MREHVCSEVDCDEYTWDSDAVDKVLNNSIAHCDVIKTDLKTNTNSDVMKTDLNTSCSSMVRALVCLA